MSQASAVTCTGVTPLCPTVTRVPLPPTSCQPCTARPRGCVLLCVQAQPVPWRCAATVMGPMWPGPGAALARSWATGSCVARLGAALLRSPRMSSHSGHPLGWQADPFARTSAATLPTPSCSCVCSVGLRDSLPEETWPWLWLLCPASVRLPGQPLWTAASACCSQHRRRSELLTAHSSEAAAVAAVVLGKTLEG